MYRKIWAVAGASALVAAFVVGQPGAAMSSTGNGPPAGQAGSAQASMVTLLTGDRVWVKPAGNGQRPMLSVVPAVRSSPVAYATYQHGGDWYVLPADAAPLVRAGQVDVDLFNVSGLVRAGLDDPRAGSIPLIVRYTDKAVAKRAAAPVGASVARRLPALGMTALKERKGEAARFWSGLVGTRPPALGAGLNRIWLDKKVCASLDVSVPQVRAPQAWAAGLTGAGVTVAVLDTGIDTDHPDLVDAIGPTRDFSGKGNVEDGHGHGTHVASIITGSGAASSGRYKGVAPDARLAVGKVLGDDGLGSYDSVLAGMQWAAGEVGARVVNMSLGGGPTDGTDPLSLAVNDLTRQTGTLFVVAAGNAGSPDSVKSPAAADEALAVASVDKSDQLSWYSSRGPRVGDGAVKPEIAAPGQDIVAARPPDVPPLGEPVGDYYQKLSGTSMATPHVSGAAAILVQQHPDWTADQLKAALMSTAEPIADQAPFDVGTGRLDVARLVNQPVTAAPGSASVFLRWPNIGVKEERTVTYRNSGSAAVTLDLSLAMTRDDGQPAPADQVTLSADHLTIPAGGQAQVTLTITGQPGQAGHYQGVLVGRSADGATVLRTAVGVYQEPVRHGLTVRLVDHNGQPSHNSYASLADLDTGNTWWLSSGDTLRLPEGRYAIHGYVESRRSGMEPEYTIIVHPELALTEDTTVLLDGRYSQPVSASVADKPALDSGYHQVMTMSTIAGQGWPFTLSLLVYPGFNPVYLGTLPGTSSPTFAAGQLRQAQEPTVELASLQPTPFDVWTTWWQPPTQALNHRSLRAVYGGAGLPEDLDKVRVAGSLVVLEVPGDLDWNTVVARINRVAIEGGVAVMLRWVPPPASGRPTALPAVAVDGSDSQLALPTLNGYSVTAVRLVDQIKQAPSTVSLVGRPYPDSRYELTQGVQGQVSQPLRYEPARAELVPVDTTYHSNLTGDYREVSATASLYGTSFLGWGTERVPAPGQRTEYFTPGTWGLYSTGSIGWIDYLAENGVQLVAGQPATIAWNKAVAGPATRTTGWGTRYGRTITLAPQMFSDSAGRPRQPTLGMTPPDLGSITLYYNGNWAGRVDQPDYAAFDVPEEPATVGLDAQVTRQLPEWTLSTTVRAQWTFRSQGGTEPPVLPLLTVRFDPAVDPQNRAHPGQFTIPATVIRQDGTPTVTDLAVEVSYDDGATWTAAPATRSGSGWNVQVNQPAGRYASLRASATDSDGNTVVQTIIRAYQIR
jgi:subtilisin family serine protease